MFNDEGIGVDGDRALEEVGGEGLERVKLLKGVRWEYKN